MPYDDRRSHSFQLTLSTETLAKLAGLIRARSHSYNEAQLLAEMERSKIGSQTLGSNDPRTSADRAFGFDSSELSTIRAPSVATTIFSVEDRSHNPSVSSTAKNPFSTAEEIEILPASRRTTIGDPPPASFFAQSSKDDRPRAPPAFTQKSISPPGGGRGGSSGSTSSSGSSQVQYPSGLRLYSLIFTLYLAGFLTALDRTILAAAIPTITARFDSISDIGWYGSSYLFTFRCFQLLFGKTYAFYNAKWVFMIALPKSS